MARRIGGITLCVLAGLMVLGFAQARSVSAASMIALLIGAGIPGTVGIALLTGRLGSGGRLGAATIQLRRQTIEAEILRLAGQHKGKLTVVEVVSELALDHAEASAVLEDLSVRGVADIQVTDAGTLVYDFRDVRLGEKGSARDVLE